MEPNLVRDYAGWCFWLYLKLYLQNVIF